MLLPVPLSRAEYLDVLDSVDVPLPLVPILEAMACPALVPEITSDKHLTSSLTDAHLDTWFHVQDANDLAATLKETPPGDSLADLLFSILLCPVLAEVQELESKLGLAFDCSKSPERIFAKAVDPQEVLCTDITFADDTRDIVRPFAGNISVRTVRGIRTMTFSVLHTGWMLRASFHCRESGSC